MIVEEAQSKPEVEVRVVDEPREALVLWRPVGDLTETEVATCKAYVAQQSGPLTQAPNAFVSDYETIQAFALAGALAPPEDPRQVANIYRRSSSLRPCVESIATNTVGFAHSLEPVFELDHADAPRRIREAIVQDRLAQDDESEPTDADVAEVRARIEKEMLRERHKLERFFNYICPTRSFTRLRWESRIEVEGGGNAYWEVIRRGDQTHSAWDRIEAHTMRLRRTEQHYFDIPMHQRRSPLAYETVPTKMRFRTYVQLVLGGAKAVYFKQYGDPRTLSSATGRWYPSPQLLEMSEPGVPPATEIIHWRAFDTIGPYGVPRWYGAQYAVMGNLAAERVNYDYFDNKAIPPFAVFVSGGKLAPTGITKLEELMKAIRGQANFWKILVLEADSSGGPNAKCKIEIHPLLKRSEEDAMFQEYEAQNAKKIQAQWRLPDLLVGRSEETNRAQAEAVLEMAEQQVFQPFREEEDDFYNRFILPEMGILYWRFKTNSAVAHDPKLQTDIATAWAKAGALTGNELRAIASDVMNKDFAPTEEPWGNIPPPIVVAGVSAEKSMSVAIIPGSVDGVRQPVGADAEKAAQDLAQRLIATRNALAGKAEGDASLAATVGRAREATQVVKMARDDWDRLWDR